MRTTMPESLERSSSPLADRLERLCRTVDDVRVPGHRRGAESALREADHPEVTTLSYLTVLALVVVPVVALVVFTLFP